MVTDLAVRAATQDRRLERVMGVLSDGTEREEV